MKQKETLQQTIEHIEQEARMALPGIQALFGFQLIAVFNQRFPQLDESVQILHFAAILLTAVSVALVLAPAAYHREAMPRHISDSLCKIGSRCLASALFVLATSISLDIFVIANLIFKGADRIPVLGAGFIFLVLVTAWFIFPFISRGRAAREV